VLEVVGLQSAFDLAYDLLKPGGTLSSVGAHTSAKFGLADAYNKNITFKIGRCPARAYMSKILPFLESKALDLSGFITHYRSLKEGPEAYKLFDQKLDKCIKLAFRPV
jgi:threonine dehydrogenase-like Zn-dependent dehydrogenase